MFCRWGPQIHIREKYTFKISIIILFYNSKLNVLNVVRQLIAKRFKGRHNFVFIQFESCNVYLICYDNF